MTTAKQASQDQILAMTCQRHRLLGQEACLQALPDLGEACGLA
jgi:hypothetical protein